MRKKLHQYSDNELKRLYSRKDLYEMTQSLLEYEGDGKNSIGRFLDTSRQTPEMAIKWNNYQIDFIKYNNSDNNTEWLKKYIEIIEICNDILKWTKVYFGNEDDEIDDVEIIETETEDGSIEVSLQTNLKSKYEKIHKNDYNDIRNGKATKEEMYLFIWNTLRFLSLKKLQILVDTYQNLYITNKPGVKSSNKMILVYDEKDNLITTYKNRNECIESENMSKQNLYKYLKDGKLHKGKRFVESD